METNLTELQIKGKAIKSPSITINNKTLVVTGKWIRTVAVNDEAWIADQAVDDPELFIAELKQSKLKADIFTFAQKLTDTLPKYNYYMEWDNVAALPIKTFEYWWTKQINDKTRNMVRKAQKNGVVVRVTEFDNTLIEGIASIYNETPVRQGRSFWHYGKDIDTIRIENSSFLERSDFLGAYCGDDLIGFIKLVYTGEVAGMMQILSKIKARDRAPNNALVAKAVEICAEKGIGYLTYSKFIYGKKGIDPVAQFKHHNGFKKINVPIYYVPLNLKGLIALKLGLHREFSDLLPQRLLSHVRKLRAKWYEKKFKK